MKEIEHLIEQAKGQNADAIQETTLTCCEKLSSLKHTEYVQTWQTRILINHCYDIRRKRVPLTGLEE